MLFISEMDRNSSIRRPAEKEKRGWETGGAQQVSGHEHDGVEAGDSDGEVGGGPA